MSTFKQELGTYDPPKLRHDLAAGLTVAMLAIPQSMAYAHIADIPPIYGLYSSIVVTIIGGIFNSYGRLVNGPTNAIGVMIADIGLMHVMQETGIVAEGGTDPVAFMQVVFLLTAMVGLLQLVGAAARLGDLANFISHSVIVGFTLGAAVLIIVKQLPRVLGIELEGELSAVETLRATAERIGETRPWTLGVGLFCTVFVLGYARLRLWVIEKGLWGRNDLPRATIRRAFRYSPGALLALIIAGIAAVVLDLESRGLEFIRMESGGLPPPSLPYLAADARWLDLVRQLLPSALAIAFVGQIECVSIAKSLSRRSRETFDPNQQLWAEGLANFFGAFLSSFAGSSSFTRSRLNVDVDAKTRFSVIFAGVFVAIGILVLRPLIVRIPLVALSGIIIAVGISLTDREQLMRTCRASRNDAIIVLTTAVWAVAFSLDGSILIGVVLSIIFFIPRSAQIYAAPLIRDDKGIVRERSPEEPACSRLAVLDIEGTLFFGALPQLERELRRLESDPATHKLIRIHNVHHMDAETAEELSRFIEEQHGRGVRVMLCGIRPQHTEVLRRIGLLELLGAGNVFPEDELSRNSTVRAVGNAYLEIGPHECPVCAAEKPGDMDPFTYMI